MWGVWRWCSVFQAAGGRQPRTVPVQNTRDRFGHEIVRRQSRVNGFPGLLSGFRIPGRYRPTGQGCSEAVAEVVIPTVHPESISPFLPDVQFLVESGKIDASIRFATPMTGYTSLLNQRDSTFCVFADGGCVAGFRR